MKTFTKSDILVAFTHRIPLIYFGMGNLPTMGGCYLHDFGPEFSVMFVSGQHKFSLSSSRKTHGLQCTVTPVQFMAEPVCSLSLLGPDQFAGKFPSDIYNWLVANAGDVPASLPVFAIGACYPGNGVVYRVTGALTAPSWESDGFTSEDDAIANGYSYAPATNATTGGTCTLEFHKGKFCGELRHRHR